MIPDELKAKVALLPEPLKRRLLLLLREKQWRGTDKLRSYVPLPGLEGFHKTRKRYAMIFGGNRSGKTEGNMADLALVFRNLHPWYKDRPEIKTLWAATINFEMVGKILWEEKLQRMIPKRELSKIVWYNKARGIPLELHHINGRRIEFKAYEQGADSFQGRSIHGIYVDEQMPESIWRECQMRIADTAGFIKASWTPVIYQEWLKQIADNPPPDYWVGYASLNDNRKSRGGYVLDAIIDALIEEWPESVRVTRIEGRFAGFESAVFDEWRSDLSVVNPRDLPRDWEFYIGVDFGYSNPFCALLTARDPDGGWWLIAEHHKSHMLLSEHAQIIKSWQEKFSIREIYGDHAAQERAEMRKLGIYVNPARKEVLNSINCVNAKMKVLRDGKPRLFVFRPVPDDWRGCPNLLRQIPAYRWAEKTATRNAKEEVLKLDDHAVDAMKMVIYTVEHQKNGSKTPRGGALMG